MISSKLNEQYKVTYKVGILVVETFSLNMCVWLSMTGFKHNFKPEKGHTLVAIKFI